MLEIRSISKSFRSTDQELTVLSELDLSIGTGEFLAIKGVSGSGKTTLLSLMAGLDVPDSGEIYFDGERVDRMAEGERAALRLASFGFVFQDFHLVPSLTVLENVAVPAAFLGGRFKTDSAAALLESVNLSERMHYLPAKLSGGEKQRVAIARALVNDPKIVFADEPTGNLDDKTSAVVMDLIIEKTRESGRTLVLVSHDQRAMKDADRILSLENGQLHEAG